jgi:transcription elongation factor Elf1
MNKCPHCQNDDESMIENHGIYVDSKKKIKIKYFFCQVCGKQFETKKDI